MKVSGKTLGSTAQEWGLIEVLLEAGQLVPLWVYRNFSEISHPPGKRVRAPSHPLLRAPDSAAHLLQYMVFLFKKHKLLIMCQNSVLLIKYDIHACCFHFIEESNNANGKTAPRRKGQNNLVGLYFSLLSNLRMRRLRGDFSLN